MPQTSAESTIASFLLSNGFTKPQTAGIMGNLYQEHKFNTTDVGGGLGIAQWIGGRRAALMAKPNYLSLNTQLEHLLHELNTTEKVAGQAIRSAQSVEQAVVAFQNLFERCGVCMESQRISYAYGFYEKL